MKHSRMKNLLPGTTNPVVCINYDNSALAGLTKNARCAVDPGKTRMVVVGEGRHSTYVTDPEKGPYNPFNLYAR